MRWILLVLVLGASPLAAQGVGPFLRQDKVAEYGGGAALNLLSRGPWIAKPWRHPILRFVGVQAVSLTYEKLLDWNGFNANDVRERAYGYLIMEGVITLGHWLVHR
jgi:hypothetical protein